MKTRTAYFLDIAVEACLMALLAYLPLAFGGMSLHRRAPAFILAIAVTALTILRLAFGTKENSASEPPRDLRRFFGPLALFCCYLLLILFQISPLGFHHPAPYHGFVGLMTGLTAYSIFFGITAVYRKRDQVRRLVYLIVALGLFEAIYGLAEWGSGRRHIYGFVKRAYADVATGTFINRNHYAAYLVMSLALLVGLIAYRLAHEKRRNNGTPTGRREKTILMVFFLVIGLGAIAASGSRAAPMTLLAAAVAPGVMIVRGASRPRYILASAAVVVLALVFTVWIGLEPLNPRYGNLSDEIKAPDARPQVYATSLKIWRSAPLLGTGAGTFADVFRSFRPPFIQAYYDHAHNDYLEILVETGLAGFLLFYGAVAWSLRLALRDRARRKSRFARAYSFGALIGAFAMLYHGLVDFNLSIPANLTTFFALLALANVTAGRRLEA